LLSAEELRRVDDLIAGLVDAPTVYDSRSTVGRFSRKALDGLEAAEMVTFRDQITNSSLFQLSLSHLLASRVVRMVQ
jgi:hypothetical protein